MVPEFISQFNIAIKEEIIRLETGKFKYKETVVKTWVLKHPTQAVCRTVVGALLKRRERPFPCPTRLGSSAGCVQSFARSKGVLMEHSASSKSCTSEPIV